VPSCRPRVLPTVAVVSGGDAGRRRARHDGLHSALRRTAGLLSWRIAEFGGQERDAIRCCGPAPSWHAGAAGAASARLGDARAAGAAELGAARSARRSRPAHTGRQWPHR
jgi:hypothetical protein